MPRPTAIPPKHRILFGLFIREMPRSYKVRLEPEPKGCAYIPKSNIASHGAMPDGGPSEHWFVVAEEWIFEVGLESLSFATWGTFEDNIKSRDHVLFPDHKPIPVCKCGHPRGSHGHYKGQQAQSAECLVVSCECEAFDPIVRPIAGPQVPSYVKRDGEW